MPDRFYQSDQGDASFLTRFYFQEVYGKEHKQQAQASEDLSQAWYETALWIYYAAQKKNIEEPIDWCS